VPDGDWLSAAEAADALGVTPQRVRQLIHDGLLPGRRTSAGWIVPASSLGAVRLAGRGRRVTPQTAWSIITLLAVSGPPAPADARLVRLLKALPDPADDTRPWARLLGARGESARMWAHPGVLSHITADRRVSAGGATALPPDYGLTAAGGRAFLYVSDQNAANVTRQYHMQPDHAGQVTLITVPAAVVPPAGRPVPAPAGAADLLNDDDPRDRIAAVTYLSACLARIRATRGDAR